MKKIYFLLFLMGCVLFQPGIVAYAQCPIVTTSSIVASNDTTLPCGSSACANLSVLSATTTLKSTNSYTLSTPAYGPDPFGSGTLLGTLSDDIYSGVIGMPFSFCFFGNKYNNCLIGSNANICFNTGLAGAYDPWPISGPLPGSNCNATMNAIMFPWMDFLNTSGGGIYYATYGVAPCRRWVVSYNNVALFSCTGTHSTVQTVLYESTNVIDMFYQSKTDCPGWNSGFAVTGIENAAGTTFFTATGENGTDFTGTNMAWRFTPSGAPTWTYTWYSSMSPLTQIATGLTTTVCPTATHTYYVKGVATSNCDSVVVWDSVKVTVFPAAPPITGTFALCQGSIGTVADAAAGTWSSSNPAVATIGTSGAWTAVSPGTAIISYTAATGCALTQIVTVNILAPITGLTTVCLGNNSVLSNIAGGGTWSSSLPSVATINSATGVVNSVSAGVSLMSYTTPAGCLSTTPFVVNPNPVAIVNPGIVCEGSTIALTDATSGGNWISNNPSVASINSATGILTGVSGGTATITYQLPTGCFNTSPVTVNPLPAVIGGLNRVCATFDIVLSDAVPGGIWVSSDTTVATISTAGLVHGVKAGAVTITYTLPTGCLRTTPITVYPLPAAPVTADIIYCQRTSGVYPPLTAITAAGGTLNWYSGPTTTATIPTPTPVPTPGVYTWYVSQTVNQCESPTRAPITVTVHAQAPKPNIGAYKPYACQYDTIGIRFAPIPFPGIQYAWGLPSYAILKGGGLSSSSIVVEFDTSYVHNFVTLVTGDGYVPCNILDTIDVPVKIAPLATFYAKSDVCVGDTVTVALTYVSGSVADFTWDFGNDASMITANSNHGGPFHLSWGQKGDHIIKLNSYNGFDCPFHVFKDTINVHDYPDATIGGIRSLSQDAHVCIGDSVEMFAKTYNGENSYTWAPAQFYNQNNKWSIFARIYLPGYVTLTVTDPFGCTASDSALIEAKTCCTVNFPTAFTPNGDSRNNVFRPIAIGNHRIHSFRVVNRWGQVMFEGANSNCAWDGNFNGAPQDMGVYFWFIKYDCDGRTIDEKGDVTLVR